MLDLKRALVFAMSGLLILGVAQMSLAQEKAIPKVKHHVGTVKAVDSAAGTLTLEERVGEKTAEVTVLVGEKTHILRGKEAIKLSDLKEGDHVTIRYITEDSKDIARSVVIRTKR